jgi:hypothetical protein
MNRLLSWRAAFSLYLGLIALDGWMLWVTPTLSPWHWVGFGGFLIMPLTMLAMRQAGQHEGTNIHPIHLGFIGFAGYANTIFIPSIKEWYFTNTWGVGNFYVPSRTVYPLGIRINTEFIVTLHAATALVLAGLITVQWLMMLRKKRSNISIQLHRKIGALTTFVALPLMGFTGILCAIYVLRTPFNQITYAALPLIIILCLLLSIANAIKGNFVAHVDYAYSAFIILCSAALYRFVCLFIWLFRGSYTTPTQAPIDGASILTYIILIIFLVIPFMALGRLRQNLLPILSLALLLVLALIFVPWQFFGAPEHASFWTQMLLFM